MNRPAHPYLPRSQQGMALVVALVLLLVMTMIAVIAMRTTTIDLKMTTNTTLSMRAFESSEGSRTALGPTLEDHVFNRGWPQSIGGSAPATASFDIPTEMSIVDVNSDYFMGVNVSTGGTQFDLAKVTPGKTPTPTRVEDVRFRLDTGVANTPEPVDVFADIWVTRVAALLSPGSGAAQGSAYLGPGVGASGAGSHVFFDIRSEGESAGNAETVTGADYRVLVRN